MSTETLQQPRRSMQAIVPRPGPLTLVERAHALAQLAETLRDECKARTLPDDAMKVLAASVASHANVILNSLPCCAMPLPSIREQVCSEQMDALLGEGRR